MYIETDRWGSWNQWTECFADCGQPGTQSRSRACGQGEPGDIYCVGQAAETIDCVETACDTEFGKLFIFKCIFMSLIEFVYAG